MKDFHIYTVVSNEISDLLRVTVSHSTHWLLQLPRESKDISISLVIPSMLPHLPLSEDYGSNKKICFA